MPQINRVRVNNVKYNFGTQFYDDFIMRFNGKNTIYDLANGGGKSLLMLLLLQNVIPNCTLDEKQPIEKLFRSGCDNTTIHSMIEWKLDPCYQKDHFKYMTTGFCARKGRGTEDDGVDTVASASALTDSNSGNGTVSTESGSSQGSGASLGINRDSASVEYFNYCIFYREFGDNDIRNLPLVSNGQRITYNGLKAYLRDLEKNDFNVSVKIFDRKGDYQNFISQYGLFESQWEIVRGINKTEGHVRTYFESNYRTSRKVVEDLLIEEIIQKSFNNTLAVDNDEGRMAQTLLDMKDNLVELYKKHSQMSSYDRQVQAVDDFADYVQTFEDLYVRKQHLENTLFDLYIACKRASMEQEENLKSLDHLKEKMLSEMENENCAIQTAEVMSEQRSLSSMEELTKTSQMKVKSKNQQIEELTKKLGLMESANDFQDYREFARSCDEITETINNRMRDHSDIVDELKCLAYVYHENNSKDRAELREQCDQAAQKVAELEAQIEQLRKAYREADNECASCQSLKEITEKQIGEAQTRQAKEMEQAGLLVAENAASETETYEAELRELRAEYEERSSNYESAEKKLSDCKAQIAGLELMAAVLKRDLEVSEAGAQESQEEKERLDSLKKVYGMEHITELSNMIRTTYERLNADLTASKGKISALTEFITNAKNGTYVCKDPLRDKLREYLTAHYGEDVLEGHEWFRQLNAGQKRDVYKRAPFVEYSFVIKNDFDRIRQDKTLENFARGAYAIPIISEQLLYDTRLEVNKEYVAFAMKNMDFLRDDARCEAELKLAQEELEGMKSACDRLQDRANVVWDDYTFVLKQQVLKEQSLNSISDRDPAQELEDNQLQMQKLRESKEIQEERLAAEKTALDKMRAETESRSERIAVLHRIEETGNTITELYTSLESFKEKGSRASEALMKAEHDLTLVQSDADHAVQVLDGLKKELDHKKQIWETQYLPYYESGLEPETELLSHTKGLSQDMLESRFLGLKGVLDQETSDVGDKEALRKHYQISMEKSRNAIAYRGIDFEEIEKLVRCGSLKACDTSELIRIKDQLSEVKNSLRAVEEELEAQNALKNRLEGSISHGIHQVEEKFGEFKTFTCENPESFMEQHKQLILKLKSNLKNMDQRIAAAQKEAKNVFVMEKDIERIVKSAGIEVPEHIDLNVQSGELSGNDINQKTDQELHQDLNQKVDLSEYETVQKEYQTLMKLSEKKRDEFDKYKQKLMDRLNECNAQDLCLEIKLSVQMPKSVEQTKNLVDSLKETNTFIQLEKDRISKGIEDMERIKENFENRCIQTCSNIKTELDRLPGLSTITLEDERISMIGLEIPYVNEKMYKDRMSSYIDETIVMAESFKSAEDRLRYIRNRLTWKRLFSVIVTDMNAIRIHLYKRERIKDQSRYLKYEEAVGSTGQSQGIYIQFLIAIINYISSINASAQDAALLGKTIFVDNPFGAAKDIYIWEPIFKLLKTNHVQLVVPARGATPAITGRFEVNYILGQKLVDGRQQTVVVDYYSQTKESQLEYVKMDYEQATFDFVQ